MEDNMLTKFPTLNLIAAACENMGIGNKGKLPWRLKSEMKYFTEKTTFTKKEGKQNAVIMGRKTWCSIPKRFMPLPNRINVVLSKTCSSIEGAHHVTDSLEKAVKWLTSPPTSAMVDKIFIIGGESVYKCALESGFPVRVYLTRILKSYECDTFFPKLSEDEYTLALLQDVPQGIHEDDGVSYKIEVFIRHKCEF